MHIMARTQHLCVAHIWGKYFYIKMYIIGISDSWEYLIVYGASECWDWMNAIKPLNAKKKKKIGAILFFAWRNFGF